jgi:N-acetylglucosaminyl-diphospho-decaprenol L-rhamnosyltransferase
VLWRWGLVQATALFPGHGRAIDWPGPTASAGAVMAVDRRKFVELGGFDPLYLPGRLEDLDFSYRAFLQGYYACYVPEALAWHRGMATFAECFGAEGCDRLALRNTLLLEWKNLRHPAHVARALFGLAVRWTLEVAGAPWAAPGRRWTLTGAMGEAVRRWRAARAVAARPAGEEKSSGNSFARPRGKLRREREFFERFSPKRMTAEPASNGKRHATLLEATASRTTGSPVSGRPAFGDRSRKVCSLP